jgi:hypothetical protein
MGAMAETETAPGITPSLEEIQQGWQDLTLRLAQLEAGKAALEQENKSLRHVLERVVEHRQKSHGELVLLLTGLVSKLPLNDVGVFVSRLVEHNTSVNQYLAALIKGTADAPMLQPEILKTLDQTKRELTAALAPVIEELIQLDPPLDCEMLRSLAAQPDDFFLPRTLQANRCFLKGQVPRERIVREFGQEALMFFTDLTTDPKLNPRPKPEEIVLAFKSDFDTLLQQNPSALPPDKRQELLALHEKIQRSKSPTGQARAQKAAFIKASFILELLHFYEHQSTEAPDVLFAQRLPVLIEQLVVTGPESPLEEKHIAQAEALLGLVVNPDHRQMIINNVGKAGDAGKTLKYVLKFRAEKVADVDEAVADFVKHLIPASGRKPPAAESLAPIIRLIKPDMQLLVIRGIISSDRLRKQDGEALGKAIGAQLGLKNVEVPPHSQALPPEMERQMAWAGIKDMIAQRKDPAAVAAAMRDRLHAKYDADEIRQSWLTLTEADTMSLIRVICQLPYRSDGRTDAIARPVLETYVSRLMHEKYAGTYTKVVNSLKNMHKAKPDSPTLLNFLVLVRWISPEAANKMSADIGMPVPVE